MFVAHRYHIGAAIAYPLVTARHDAPVALVFLGVPAADRAGHDDSLLMIRSIASMKIAATSGTIALPAALSCATRL
jgi:hypothetical protein